MTERPDGLRVCHPTGARLRHDAAHRLKPEGQRVTRTGLIRVRASTCDNVLPLSRVEFGNCSKGLPKTCNVTYNLKFSPEVRGTRERNHAKRELFNKNSSF